MTVNGSQPGGVVRGYAGNDLDTSQAFGPRLGAVSSNNHQELPLIWQLCRKDNEVPGLATSSAILVVNYK